MLHIVLEDKKQIRALETWVFTGVDKSSLAAPSRVGEETQLPPQVVTAAVQKRGQEGRPRKPSYGRDRPRWPTCGSPGAVYIEDVDGRGSTSRDGPG